MKNFLHRCGSISLARKVLFTRDEAALVLSSRRIDICKIRIFVFNVEDTTMEKFPLLEKIPLRLVWGWPRNYSITCLLKTPVDGKK